MTTTERALRAFWWRVSQGIQKSFYVYLSRHVDDDVLFMNWAYEEGRRPRKLNELESSAISLAAPPFGGS
jgi:hypothetical protein